MQKCVVMQNLREVEKNTWEQPKVRDMRYKILSGIHKLAFVVFVEGYACSRGIIFGGYFHIVLYPVLRLMSYGRFKVEVE